MPRRFFRKFAFKRHEVSRQWFMTPFRHLLHDNRLWGIRRRTVVPAFTLGLFVAFIPVPGHAAIAALTALALRVNIPIAAVTTLVVNPLTMGPIYFLAYRIGAYLLGIETGPFHVEMSIDWVTHTLIPKWQPMMLGSLLLGGGVSLIGYIVLDILWRTSLGKYKTRKRNHRNSTL
jgi:uncharacterized protein (DUF2062 family)